MSGALSTVLLLLLQQPVRPANFSGKWILEFSGRGGRITPLTLSLNQVGHEVSGTVSVPSDRGTGSPVYPEIWGGTAIGNRISFYLWVGRDRPVKAVFEGTMREDGTIEFLVTGPAMLGNYAVPQGDPVTRKVLAKRSR